MRPDDKQDAMTPSLLEMARSHRAGAREATREMYTRIDAAQVLFGRPALELLVLDHERSEDHYGEACEQYERALDELRDVVYDLNLKVAAMVDKLDKANTGHEYAEGLLRDACYADAARRQLESRVGSTPHDVNLSRSEVLTARHQKPAWVVAAIAAGLYNPTEPF